MSNGLYQRLACDCGAVCLLVCGAPLGGAVDPAGEPATLWPLEAVQVGEGVDELVSREASGGVGLSCRRCGEVVGVEHAEAGVVALPGAADNAQDAAPPAAPSRAALEALGYRFPSKGNG
ncbi:hypothetical protein ABE957_15605 [Halomonas sp. CS7]|uniref:DUF2946 domain-containing protein n=1 Tax=Halomonas pelophila TaxID=3151122 RepID=A0ABV1N8N1_9GAMM